MVEIPENIKYLLFGYGPKLHALMALIANLLGIFTFLLGVVSVAMQSPIGLQGTTWFILTIVFFLWGISFWLGAYFGAKEGYTGKK